jgi:pilus assembly protein CpaF
VPAVSGRERATKALSRVSAHLRRAGIEDPQAYLAGLPWAGPLESYVHDEQWSDLEVGSDGLLVAKGGGGRVKVTGEMLSEAWVQVLVGLWRQNRGGDGVPRQPWTETTTGGWRYTYIPAAFSMAGPMLSIRLRHRSWTLDDLVDVGMMDDKAARALATWAPSVPILISGGSGAGKTAVQEAILRSLPRLTRVILVTQEIEFTLEAPRMAFWELNQDYPDVTLAYLVSQALKCQPDQIVVGEVRGAEAAEWILALNSGVPGGSVTVHANGIREAPEKLVSLGVRSGLWPQAELASWLATRHPLLVHAGWEGDKRRIAAIGELVGIVKRKDTIHYSVEVLYDGEQWYPERMEGRLRSLLETRG